MKKWISIILLLVIVGLAYGYYEYSRGPRNLQKEKTDLAVSAIDLVLAFESDETAANSKYLDKVIEVKGTVIEVQPPNNIVLDADNIMSTVVCEFGDEQADNQLKVGDNVVIKGQCTGYLADVILVKSVLINK